MDAHCTESHAWLHSTSHSKAQDHFLVYFTISPYMYDNVCYLFAGKISSLCQSWCQYCTSFLTAALIIRNSLQEHLCSPYTSKGQFQHGLKTDFFQHQQQAYNLTALCFKSIFNWTEHSTDDSSRQRSHSPPWRTQLEDLMPQRSPGFAACRPRRRCDCCQALSDMRWRAGPAGHRWAMHCEPPAPSRDISVHTPTAAVNVCSTTNYS